MKLTQALNQRRAVRAFQPESEKNPAREQSQADG